MRDPKDTRETLLDTAEVLFAERGYAAVGIREIVDRAGANIGAINYHFGSKRELYLAVVRRVMERRATVSAWQMIERPPATRHEAAVALVGFIHAFLARLLGSDASAAACRLIQREAAEPSEALDCVVREFIEPNEAVLTGLCHVIAPDADDEQLGLHAQSILGQVLHYHAFRPLIERTTVGPIEDGGVAIATHIARVTLAGLGLDAAECDAAIGAGGEVVT